MRRLRPRARGGPVREDRPGTQHRDAIESQSSPEVRVSENAVLRKTIGCTYHAAECSDGTRRIAAEMHTPSRRQSLTDWNICAIIRFSIGKLTTRAEAWTEKRLRPSGEFSAATVSRCRSEKTSKQVPVHLSLWSAEPPRKRVREKGLVDQTTIVPSQCQGRMSLHRKVYIIQSVAASLSLSVPRTSSI